MDETEVFLVSMHAALADKRFLQCCCPHDHCISKVISDSTEVLQKMFTATHFANITNSMLSGNAVEADLTEAIEVFLNEVRGGVQIRCVM